MGGRSRRADGAGEGRLVRTARRRSTTRLVDAHAAGRHAPAAQLPRPTRTATCTAAIPPTWPAPSSSPSSARATRTTRGRPTTGWRPRRPRRRLGALFRGSMRGRTMYVIPYLMGPAGSSMSRVGRHGDGQRLRRREHAHHDARGRRSRSSTCARDDDFIARPALARRPLAGPALHPALPRGAADLERGLGLRRQRAARQEVPRPPHRLVAGAARRAGSPSTC